MKFNQLALFGFALSLLVSAGCRSSESTQTDPPPEPPSAATELHPQSAAYLCLPPVLPATPSAVPGILSKDIQLESETGTEIMRLYQPESPSAQPRGAVLFLHGIDRNTARFCSELAAKSGFMVAAPELHIAPESPWTAALDDALAAYNYLCTNADELGVDSERIFLAGDGIGALLAVAAAYNEYDTTGEKPTGLLLFYPYTAAEAENRGESWTRYGENFGYDAAAMEAFTDAWLPSAKERQETASLFTVDPASMPPMLVIVSGCDILRDQGLKFALQLRKGEVPVRIRRYNGALHGFLTRPGLELFLQKGIADAALFLAGNGSGK